MLSENTCQTGFLNTLPPQKLHLLIGEITALLMVSEVHRKYQIRDIADIVLRPVNLNQFKLYRDAQKRPIALLTWGWLSEDVERRYIAGDMLLTEQELQSGDRLWFPDFIAPYGHAKQVMQHIKRRSSPVTAANRCGRRKTKTPPRAF